MKDSVKLTPLKEVLYVKNERGEREATLQDVSRHLGAQEPTLRVISLDDSLVANRECNELIRLNEELLQRNEYLEDLVDRNRAEQKLQMLDLAAVFEIVRHAKHFVDGEEQSCHLKSAVTNYADDVLSVLEYLIGEVE